ncbi:hypothetical protein CHY08_22270 (plasmid) [Rhizobium leguminosarum bv. viciae]|uniref:hypothetical protein n=1 Tax=Rhizobium leguminosarum TaxID=384 RepID=UPI000B8CC8A1|nr:hypothetical protein [Rhizobium leguminosarum]ASR09863.1 hypothetical protein CHY08_22270 [Rhizobium leguminosarum bv. viciae]
MVVPVKFVVACAAADDIFVIATIPDELPEDAEFTRLYYLCPETEEVWHYRDWPNEQVVSLCLRREREGVRRAACALTGEGDIEIANSADETYEKISGAGLMGARALGAVTRIREIGSTLFVCGNYGQVYRRDETSWTPIDGELTKLGKSALNLTFPDAASVSDDMLRQFTQSMRQAPNFNDIGGISETDIYVCGNGGNLFHYDGKAWAKIDIKTDAILTAMHCISADEVLVVGEDGIVLTGNARAGFRSLGEFFPGDYIWSVRSFQGRTYLGTLHGLYVLDGSRVRLLTSGKLDGKTQVISVDSVSDNALWIASNRHAFRYDGNAFTFYEHGDNVAY